MYWAKNACHTAVVECGCVSRVLPMCFAPPRHSLITSTILALAAGQELPEELPAESHLLVTCRIAMIHAVQKINFACVATPTTVVMIWFAVLIMFLGASPLFVIQTF